jgi:hypothetical protein
MAALRNAKLQWRPATTADLPTIQRLSDEMHSSLPERPERSPRSSRSFNADASS